MVAFSCRGRGSKRIDANLLSPGLATEFVEYFGQFRPILDPRYVVFGWFAFIPGMFNQYAGGARLREPDGLLVMVLNCCVELSKGNVLFSVLQEMEVVGRDLVRFQPLNSCSPVRGRRDVAIWMAK